MSDRLFSPEPGSRSIRERLLTLPQLEKKLLTDKSFRKQLAGCSTFSFSIINAGITSPFEVSINQYADLPGIEAHVSCDLDDAVFIQTFGFDNPQAGSGYDWIAENRRSHAPGHIAREAAIEMGADILPRLYQEDFLYQLDLFFFNANDRYPTTEGVIKAYKAVFEKYADGDKKYQKLVNIFGSESRLVDYIQSMRGRKGVQVLYGASDKFDFTKFILSTDHEQVDDRAVSIQANIPNRFILALVPLGPYEQEKFRHI
jgi:hypothetical protein